MAAGGLVFSVTGEGQHKVHNQWGPTFQPEIIVDEPEPSRPPFRPPTLEVDGVALGRSVAPPTGEHASSPKYCLPASVSQDTLTCQLGCGSWSSRLRTVLSEYKVEENIYGYVTLHGHEYPMGSYMLLCLHYFIAMGLTVVITIVMMSKAMQDPAGPPLCSYDYRSGAYDCEPAGISNLTNFSQLDTNGDGAWTVAEARAAGMLTQFRTIHDLALKNQDILEAAMASEDSVPNLACYVLTTYTEYLQYLSANETMMLIRMSNRAMDDIKCGGSARCLINQVCRDMLEIPEKTPRQKYLEETHFMSSMDASLHEALVDNLVKPCYIVNPSLCGNAELPKNGSSYLASVPMWRRLTPEQRVKECRAFTSEICPDLLGTQYEMHQTGIDEICGQKSYSAEEVPRPPPQPPVGRLAADAALDSMQVGECADNSTLAELMTFGVVQANPIMALFWTVVQRVFAAQSGASPSTDLLASPDCIMAAAMGFCDETAKVVDPSGKMETLGFMVASACPHTCCTQKSFSCPVLCTAWPSGPSRAHPVQLPTPSSYIVNATFGTIQCLGKACASLIMKPDGASNSICIERRDFPPRDAVRLIIRTEEKLRVYIVKIDIEDKMGRENYGPDDFCLRNHLTIDGKAYCKYNAPEYVEIPRRQGGLVEVAWLAQFRCPFVNSTASGCGWEMRITDSGEPTTFSVNVASLELVDEYHDSSTGVISSIFHFFFDLISVVWVLFVFQELVTIQRLYYFLWCPELPGGSRRRRRLLLCVFLPRLAIALWVAIVGIILLIVSRQFLEILLNAVALAFILDVDEILFQIGTPVDVKRSMRHRERIMWQTPESKVNACSRVLVKSPSMQVALEMILVVVLAVGVAEGVYLYCFVHRAAAVDCICSLTGEKCRSAVL